MCFELFLWKFKIFQLKKQTVCLRGMCAGLHVTDFFI